MITPLFALITASGLFYFLGHRVAAADPAPLRRGRPRRAAASRSASSSARSRCPPRWSDRWPAALGDVVGRRTMAVVGAAVAAVSIVPLGLVARRLVPDRGAAASPGSARRRSSSARPPPPRTSRPTIAGARRRRSSPSPSTAAWPSVRRAGEWIYRNHGRRRHLDVRRRRLCALSMVLALFIPS